MDWSIRVEERQTPLENLSRERRELLGIPDNFMASMAKFYKEPPQTTECKADTPIPLHAIKAADCITVTNYQTVVKETAFDELEAPVDLCPKRRGSRNPLRHQQGQCQPISVCEPAHALKPDFTRNPPNETKKTCRRGGLQSVWDACGTTSYETDPPEESEAASNRLGTPAEHPPTEKTKRTALHHQPISTFIHRILPIHD